MVGTQKTTKLIGAGIITAIASSLCCITPILALVAGSSGVATTFSWLAPARPYLIGFTVLVLGYAWWQKLKLKKELACNCEEDKKQSFLQSKTFLVMVTVFAFLMTALPYYSDIFYAKSEKKIEVLSRNKLQKITLTIAGMTCDACQNHINNAINELPGILLAKTSYEKGNAWVEFDNTKTSIKAIEEAVNSTGYTVTKTELE